MLSPPHPSATSGLLRLARAFSRTLLAAALLAAAAVPLATAQSVRTGSGLRGFEIQRSGVKSVYDLRWEHVVRQHLEIGCGAAALATILSYHFDFPATEQEMADALWADATRGKPAQAQQQTQHLGFSLGNIQRVAEQGGLTSAGFAVEAKNLDQLKIPAISQLTIKGYPHFVVIRGTQNGRVYIADPAFGNTTYRLPAFEKIYSGVLLAFTLRSGSPASSQDALTVQADEPLGVGLDQSRRIVRLREVPLTRFTNQSSYRISTFPMVSPRITGLESVFPTFIGSRVVF